MKRKIFLYAGLLLMGIMGALSTGVVRAAETTITHYPDAGISYTLNNGTKIFPAGTITITDGTDTITILDRNLGATTNDVSNTGSYGYHFQWGNNRGFPSTGDLPAEMKSNSQVPFSQVTSGYSSGVFHYGNGNWIDDDSKIDMRGGSTAGTDAIRSTSSLNGDNWKVDNAEERQGPCPEGFHVPSVGELVKLVSMMTGANDSEKVSQLHNELYIPFAGNRYYSDTSVSNPGSRAYLWSSSPNSAYYDYSLHLDMYVNGNLWMNYYGRANAYSLRCFHDFYRDPQSSILSFDSQGGSAVEEQTVAKNGTGTKPTDPTKTGYDFKYRYLTGHEDTPFDFENTLITEDTTLYAKREGTPYTITLDLNGGTGIETTQTIRYGENISLGTPTRGGYRFLGREPVLPATMPGENLNVKATWKKKSSNSSSSSSSSSSEINTGSTTDQPSSGANTKDPEDNKQPVDSSDKSSEGQDDGFTQEFIDAYNFAFQNGITTMPTIDQADMTGNLTRIQMAKMLSYYAINVMGKKPDETRNNKFNDVSEKLNSDYNSGVTLAYQLGIMGINMQNNNFRPNDLVTRGEFVTALSRMIYGTKDGEYENTNKYYTKHIEKLNEEEIIKQIDPSMKELRAYVMIMLKRASEK